MVNKQTLLVNKYIRKLICEEISELQNRVFPLDARMSTKFPFAVLTRDSVATTSFTKDGITEDTVTISVYVLTRDYDSGVTIANNIRNLLDHSRYRDDTIVISLIKFIGADENYTDTGGGAFLQQLKFEIKI
jgi:hypothetical protein